MHFLDEMSRDLSCHLCSSFRGFAFEFVCRDVLAVLALSWVDMPFSFFSKSWLNLSLCVTSLDISWRFRASLEWPIPWIDLCCKIDYLYPNCALGWYLLRLSSTDLSTTRLLSVDSQRLEDTSLQDLQDKDILRQDFGHIILLPFLHRLLLLQTTGQLQLLIFKTLRLNNNQRQLINFQRQPRRSLSKWNSVTLPLKLTLMVSPLVVVVVTEVVARSSSLMHVSRYTF